MVGSVIVLVDEASPEPSCMQLAARLRERIQAGEIVSRLPSLTELTGQTGLAVGTVRRAIHVLAQEHLVRTVSGRGTFVIAARR
jgi:DNA-binding GntR family transcriptional regulator